VFQAVVSDPEVTDLPLPVCAAFVKEFLFEGNANFLTLPPTPRPLADGWDWHEIKVMSTCYPDISLKPFHKNGLWHNACCCG